MKKITKKTIISILTIVLLLILATPCSPHAASKYTGTYKKTWKAQMPFKVYINPGYGMVINKVKKNKICFQIDHYGVNGSPLYTTNVIDAKLNKKRASFSWSDTWGNSGTGKLKLGNGYVKVKMKQTYTARINRSSLDTGNKYYKLKKTSNSRKLLN